MTILLMARSPGRIGALIDKDCTAIQPGYVYVNKERMVKGNACALFVTMGCSPSPTQTSYKQRLSRASARPRVRVCCFR